MFAVRLLVVVGCVIRLECECVVNDISIESFLQRKRRIFEVFLAAWRQTTLSFLAAPGSLFLSFRPLK